MPTRKRLPKARPPEDLGPVYGGSRTPAPKLHKSAPLKRFGGGDGDGGVKREPSRKKPPLQQLPVRPRKSPGPKPPYEQLLKRVRHKGKL